MSGNWYRQFHGHELMSDGFDGTLICFTMPRVWSFAHGSPEIERYDDTFTSPLTRRPSRGGASWTISNDFLDTYVGSLSPWQGRYTEESRIELLSFPMIHGRQLQSEEGTLPAPRATVKYHHYVLGKETKPYRATRQDRILPPQTAARQGQGSIEESKKRIRRRKLIKCNQV